MDLAHTVIELVYILIPGFGIWLTGLPEHGTTVNQPLWQPVYLDNLMQAIHASGMKSYTLTL